VFSYLVNDEQLNCRLLNSNCSSEFVQTDSVSRISVRIVLTSGGQWCNRWYCCNVLLSVVPYGDMWHLECYRD